MEAISIKKSVVNSIICGDCVDRMKEHLPDETVDLIYLDPPFFSGRNYDLIWGEGESQSTIQSFEDARFYKKVCGKCGKNWEKTTDGKDCDRCYHYSCDAVLKDAKDVRVNDINAYLAWLKERLRECHRVLRSTGSIYLHLDWHAVHYAKVMMDDIFGYDNFQNEIIWCYRTGGATKKRFSRKHDSLLFYSKAKNYKFNCIKDRIYYDKAFFNPKIDDNGRYYADVLPVDFWEIPAVINVSKERLGYPTQKPKSLLEKIIRASSNEGDIVLDPFCGCGTTIDAAETLKRKWIGIDIEPLSCTIQQTRMAIEYSLNVKVLDLGKQILTEEEIREKIKQETKEARDMEPYAFQNWVVGILEGKQTNVKGRDGGIDGWINKPHGYLLKGDIIQVKRSDKVGIDVVQRHAGVTQLHGRKSGLIVAFGFTVGAKKEAKAFNGKKDGVNIKLMSVKELLVLTDKRTKQKSLSTENTNKLTKTAKRKHIQTTL